MNQIAKKLLFTSLCLIILAACAPQAVNNPPAATPTEIPVATPTEISFSEGDFVLSVRLDFESNESLKYFDILGGAIEGQETTQSDSVLKDGSVIIGQSPAGGAHLKPRLNYGTALHIRWKINAEDTCERFNVKPYLRQEEQVENVYGIGVGGCSFQNLQTELVTDKPADYDSPYQGQGSLVMEDGQWLDAVFWIEKGTPSPTLKLFAWQTENPNIYYYEKRLLNGLEEANMFMVSFEVFNGSFAVDSFQMISGNIESYLWFNAPAFSKNYDSVAMLFNMVLDNK
ncbi:MAG: hypothetical protein FP831_08035 [Anaerolineae bacterium]|nr:hypothetical protein [Anaerolineae bacterium]